MGREKHWSAFQSLLPLELMISVIGKKLPVTFPSRQILTAIFWTCHCTDVYLFISLLGKLCVLFATPDTHCLFSRHASTIFSFRNLSFLPPPFLCVKGMYWLCAIPVASCKWCMNWKIFALYTVGIQKVLCSHCCAMLFSIYTDTPDFILYSFWQVLQVYMSLDGMDGWCISLALACAAIL